MPRFLEQRLKAEAHAKGFTGERANRYAYGAMNNMGAMKGSVETPKGAAMQEKHARDMGATHPNRNLGKYLHPKKSK